MLTRRDFLRLGVAVGALLACAPLLGLLGTMVGMIRAFHTLGQSGIGDPRALSGAMGQTLLATAGGLVLAPVGVVLLIVCAVLLRQSRRAGPPPLPRFPENAQHPPDSD